jgi:hypothetical protein
MKKLLRIVLFGLGIMLLLVGAGLFLHGLDEPLSNLITAIVHRPPNASWTLRFHAYGPAVFILGALLILAAFTFTRIPKLIAFIITKMRIFNRWLELKISKFPVSESRLALAERWPAFNLQDGLILAFFLLYALIVFLGMIEGNFPNPLMGGDAGNTASFAAVLDHPHLFPGDLILNDANNVLIYSTFNVFFMRLLFPLLSSYTLSMAILVPIQIFLQLTGFYLLGRVLFGGRWWGIALTTLLSLTFTINLGESWGLPTSPIARSNFQALLPFVLCMVLVWRSKPARWPWIMAALGVLFYMHPVSTPCWAVAIWLSLFFSVPHDWKFGKRLGYMFVMGLVFLAVALPFVVNYLSNHVQGQSLNYDLVFYTIVKTFPENLLNIPAAMQVFADLMTQNGLLPAALISLVGILILRRSNREPFKILLIWILGILLMAVFVPLTIHTVEKIFRLIPVESEMARAIRYLIPIMLLLILWFAYEVSLRIPLKPLPGAFYSLVLAVTLIGGTLWAAPMQALQDATACLLQGKIICNNPTDYDLLLQAIKTKVPEKSAVYVTFGNNGMLSYGMPIRYIAMRPLIYAFKDRALLVYSNNDALIRWGDMNEQTYAIDVLHEKTRQGLSEYLDLAKSLGAQYVVADFHADLSTLTGTQAKEIYSNKQFTLLELQ